MKTTHYFLHYSYGTMARNILQEYFEEYLKCLNGRIITEFELTKLKTNIQDQVNKLNLKFKRCKPIDFRFYENEGVIHMHGTHVNFCIRPAFLTQVDNLKQIEL